MDNAVENVGKLNEDSLDLYNKVVEGEADGIVNVLESAIENLKSNWEGMDAGTQINNVVEVLNGMIGVREALAELASNSSGVANYYREIQQMNRAGADSEGSIPDLVKIGVKQGRAKMPAFHDMRDKIKISPEANVGKNKLDSTIQDFEKFRADAQAKFDEITGNWTAGPGREKAVEAFKDFLSNADRYKELLSNASESVSTAIKNYRM